MSHLLVSKKFDSDSSEDSDYNPEEDPEYQKEVLSKPDKSDKILKIQKEKIENIWVEMNAPSDQTKFLKPLNETEVLKLSQTIIKKQKEDLMNNMKTVIFAGSEYLVDKAGNLRLKTKLVENAINSADDAILLANSENNTTYLENSLINEISNENNAPQKIPDNKNNILKEDLKKRFDYLKKILEKLNNKPKVINAVKKSKMDWSKFTKKERIEDKLEKNRKNGILQKQSFLNKVNDNVKNLKLEILRKRIRK